MRSAMLSAVALVVGMWCAADAVVVPGGGGSKTDCLTAFDAAANIPASRPKEVRCADGDPCDTDGVVNGQCVFAVAVCANGTFDPTRCTSPGVNDILVDHAQDNGDPLFDP